MTKISAPLLCTWGSWYGTIVYTNGAAIVLSEDGAVVRIVDGPTILIVDCMGARQSQMRAVAMNRASANKYPNQSSKWLGAIDPNYGFARQCNRNYYSYELPSFLGCKMLTKQQ